MSEELNCLNCCIGDFKHNLCDCDNGFCKEFKSIGKEEDFFNAVMQRIGPQGEWIRNRYWSRGVGMGEEYGFFYKCSLCEYEVENGYTKCGFNYCPYCGAKMKGADDE